MHWEHVGNHFLLMEGRSYCAKVWFSAKYGAWCVYCPGAQPPQAEAQTFEEAQALAVVMTKLN